MARMRNASIAYRIAKKCEWPQNTFWDFANFFFCQAMILRGLSVYKKIRREHPDKKLVLFPTNSAGDVALFGRFSQYLYNNILEKEEGALLICSEYLTKPMRSIGITNIYPINGNDVAALSMMNHFYGEERTGISPAYAFEIGDFANIQIKPNHLRFDNHPERVSCELKNAKCLAGNTVVLSPYENSVSDWGEKPLSMDFWSKLASALKSEGFDVCTNCAGGEKEPPVPGTERVFPSYGDSMELVSQAGAAVAIRSGFVDFISMTPGTLVTLYPSINFWKKNSLCQNQSDKFINHMEIVYDCDDQSAEYIQGLISRIVGFIKNAEAN